MASTIFDEDDDSLDSADEEDLADMDMNLSHYGRRLGAVDTGSSVNEATTLAFGTPELAF